MGGGEMKRGSRRKRIGDDRKRSKRGAVGDALMGARWRAKMADKDEVVCETTEREDSG